MSSSNPNNADIVDSLNQRIDAIDAHTQPNDPILLGGQTKTAAEVKAMYTGYVAARDAVTDAQKAEKVALANRQKSEAERRSTDKAFKSWVVSKYGADSKEAHDFGFPPPKPREVKATTKAHATLQAKATRKARHTMGKNQKAGIKGSVPPIEELVSQAEGAATGGSTGNGAAPSAANGAGATTGQPAAQAVVVNGAGKSGTQA